MISILGKVRIRWQLMFYDVVIYLIVLAFIATTYGLAGSTREEFILGSVAALAALLICRTLGMVYSMIIRYGGVHVYMRLFATDFFVILGYFPIKFGLGLTHMTSQRWLILILLNLLGAVGIRLMYRYCYRYGVRRTKKGQFLRSLLLLFAGDNVVKERRDEHKRIRIAILGAGRLGAVLADELLSNDSAAYVPVCFIDQDENKTGRLVMGLPVLSEGEDGLEDLKDYGVQEIVFAITNIINTKKDGLFKLYKELASKKIRVNAVLPGITRTAIFDQIIDNGGDSMDLQSILQRQYLGICEPHNIASTVAFLLAQESNFITGSEVSVDSGRLSS